MIKQWWGRSPSRSILWVASALGATVLSACAPTADAESASAPPAQSGMAGMTGPAAPAANAGAADAPVATDTVAIQNFAYSPATVTVKAGTTVTWTNSDQDPHTVTSMNGGPLRSAPLNNGDTYRYTFTTPGRYEYLCTIHPFMTAAVVVTP